MKIAVYGAGYVGLANAVVLAVHHDVTLIDIDQSKVDRINQRQATIGEPEIQAFMGDANLSLRATTDVYQAVESADWALIATPTDYDPQTHYFDTSSVESCIKDTLEINPGTAIVVRSTVPVGFTATMRTQLGRDNILFAPEFLREGHALTDCLKPSRIIVGGEPDLAIQFATILLQSCLEPDVPVLLTGSQEAEAIKLFANSYLALRVAYFNEIDTCAISQGMDPEAIICGISLDPRIGDHYNNPSFGYGGYCLPKDTKQLLANYSDIPQDIISAVVKANETRMRFIADDILARQPQVVGVHRLIMKTGSDNYRSSSVFGVIKHLLAAGVQILIYEPQAKDQVLDCQLIDDLVEFKNRCDLIITNRRSAELTDVSSKVYTRDLYNRD